MCARALLVVFDQRVGRVVVDRFEVFRFDDIGVDASFSVETCSDVAHHVLDELGIVVSTLRDVFLVRAL